MSIPVIIGIAAVFVVLGILFIIKGSSSEEEHAVPISNPKEIEAFKNSFNPSGEKGSSGLKGGMLSDITSSNGSKEAGVPSSSGLNKKSDINELAQKNEQLEQNLQMLKRENQQIKNSQLEKIKVLEGDIANIQREKERLLPNHQLIDELKEKGETFEKRCAENKVQQEELRELVRILESEKDELMTSQKSGVDESEFQALSSRLENSIATIESLKGENRNLQQLNQDLKNDFEKTKEHNTHLIEKESIVEYELSKNRAQNVGLEKICEDFKVQIERMSSCESGKQQEP